MSLEVCREFCLYYILFYEYFVFKCFFSPHCTVFEVIFCCTVLRGFRTVLGLWKCLPEGAEISHQLPATTHASPPFGSPGQMEPPLHLLRGTPASPRVRSLH